MVLIMKDLRLSSYTISVKLEAEEDKFFLVHGYTGAIDIVEGECWRQIEHFSSDNNLSAETIGTLTKRGYLTSRTLEEERQYVWKIANVLHQAQAKMHKSWGFIITYNCNFRCPYCFENSISQNGKAWTGKTFTKEMVDKAFLAMSRIEPKRKLHNNEILLYGGEPFLRNNKEVVSYIIKKGIDNNYKFKVISNGYDLDFYADVLSEEYFTSFQITLDGDKTYHNKRKRHIVEGDSFDKVLSNIGLLLSKSIKVIVRVNLDENNFQDLDGLKKLFSENGFTQNPFFHLTPALILNTDSNQDCNDVKFLNNKDFLQLLKSKSINLLRGQDFGIGEMFYDCLKKKICYQLRSTICPSQYGTYLFDPCGDIYTCLEFVGRKQHSIGHYSESIEWLKEKEYWQTRNISNMQSCKLCKYALICGGQCLARTKYTEEHGFEVTKCKMFHTQIPQSINNAYKQYIN